MLFPSRSKNLRINLTEIKDVIKRSSSNYGKRTFVGITLVVLLLGANLFILTNRLSSLEEEKGILAQVITNAPQKVNLPYTPKVEELPLMIDQCSQILQSEGTEVQSFNLERFGEGIESHTLLNYALVRFKLAGHWEGIQRGLKKIEAFPEQVIHVSEAQLNREGGEILLKIYFLEPDNPLNP